MPTIQRKHPSKSTNDVEQMTWRMQKRKINSVQRLLWKWKIVQNERKKEKQYKYVQITGLSMHYHSKYQIERRTKKNKNTNRDKTKLIIGKCNKKIGTFIVNGNGGCCVHSQHNIFNIHNMLAIRSHPYTHLTLVFSFFQFFCISNPILCTMQQQNMNCIVCALYVKRWSKGRMKECREATTKKQHKIAQTESDPCE